MIQKNLKGNYRQRKQPGIIAGAALGISLLASVGASFVLAGTSVLGPSSASQTIDQMTVTQVSSVPGFKDAECWQAYTRVGETNILGHELLAHKFGVTWCARDGGIVYQQDITEPVYAAHNMRSDNPADSSYQAARSVDSQETSTLRASRQVVGTSGWPSYGFERCVRFTFDAQGNAEGELTCHPS